MKNIGLLLICCVLVGTAQAASAPSPMYMKAMKAELKRSMAKLRRPGVEKPYFIAYKLEEITYGTFVGASLGELYTNGHRDGALNAYVWVAIGNAQKDSLGYVHDAYHAENAYQPRYFTDVAKSYRGLRQALWLLTDRAYTFAAETYQQKQAYERTKQTDDKEKLPDVIPAKQATYTEEIAPLPACDEAQAQAWVKEQSARGKEYPFIEQFQVHVVAVRRDTYYLNSRGGSYITSLPAVQVEWTAHIRNRDGVKRTYSDDIWLTNFLPENQTLAATVTDNVLEVLGNLYEASLETEPYVGPVILTYVAAGAFMYEQLAVNMQQLKGLASANDTDATAGKFVNEGQRVMAPGITVWDMPSWRSSGGNPLGGFMPVDDEGVAAQDLTLVAQGRVVELPRTTRPLNDKKPSNGHARMTHQSMPRERLTHIVVEADNPVTREELAQQLLDRCAELGLDYGYIVHEWPSAQNNYLPFVQRVYLDGHYENMYGVKIADVTTRALRDIIAATGEISLTYIGKDEAGLPAQSITAPDLLLEELELTPTNDKPDKKPFVPKP